MRDRKTAHCPSCGSEVSEGQETCPICGRALPAEKDRAAAARIPTGRSTRLLSIIGACLLLAAFAGGVTFNFSSREKTPEPSAVPEVPEVVELAAATPAPTPTPTVSAVRLYAFGRELDSDGFTVYVGDRPFTLSVEVEPAIRHPVVSWSITDSKNSTESAELSVSGDGMSCEFKAIKPTGRNELTVTCFGAEMTIPVFLWER